VYTHGTVAGVIRPAGPTSRGISTKAIIATAAPLDIAVDDHIIVSRGGMRA
jgi:hypothetical protein